MAKMYQIKITLKNTKPAIWRRVQTNADISLNELHYLVQVVMGWSNSHLHQFDCAGQYYGDERLWQESFDDFDMKDSLTTKVEKVLKKEKDKILYEYDMGDSWDHNILLEKITNVDTPIMHPICLKGAMRCPPEDCGGVWGYAGLVETMKDPNSEEYEEMAEWLGVDTFDPTEFDLEWVNKRLKNFSTDVKTFKKNLMM
jgi:hypothetical protein